MGIEPTYIETIVICEVYYATFIPKTILKDRLNQGNSLPTFFIVTSFSAYQCFQRKYSRFKFSLPNYQNNLVRLNVLCSKSNTQFWRRVTASRKKEIDVRLSSVFPQIQIWWNTHLVQYLRLWLSIQSHGSDWMTCHQLRLLQFFLLKFKLFSFSLPLSCLDSPFALFQSRLLTSHHRSISHSRRHLPLSYLQPLSQP